MAEMTRERLDELRALNHKPAWDDDDTMTLAHSTRDLLETVYELVGALKKMRDYYRTEDDIQKAEAVLSRLEKADE